MDWEIVTRQDGHSRYCAVMERFVLKVYDWGDEIRWHVCGMDNESLMTGQAETVDEAKLYAERWAANRAAGMV